MEMNGSSIGERDAKMGAMVLGVIALLSIILAIVT
jgi:hypothetical protein